MLIDSLHHEFIERSPVLGVGVVAVHRGGEIEGTPADSRFLPAMFVTFVEVVFGPRFSTSKLDGAVPDKNPPAARIISSE